MFDNEGNSAKSTNGAKLNRNVNELLTRLRNEGVISNFRKEPRYNAPGHIKEQFSPDFEIDLFNGKKIIIDNTTTARHDRFKQKQWDAHGIKTHFAAQGQTIEYYIVVPNMDEIGNEKSRSKEQGHYLNEKNKVRDAGYYSQVDDLIQVSDLEELLRQ